MQLWMLTFVLTFQFIVSVNVFGGGKW